MSKKRLVSTPKETYMHAKSNLHTCQKRPTSTPKETYIHATLHTSESGGTISERARYMSPPHSAHTSLPFAEKSRTWARIAVFSDRACA